MTGVIDEKEHHREELRKAFLKNRAAVRKGLDQFASRQRDVLEPEGIQSRGLVVEKFLRVFGRWMQSRL